MDYGKRECYEILSFLSLSNITLLFSLYIRCRSTILKFLQNFLKWALFPLSFDISSEQYLLLTKFSIFLKLTCLLLAIFLKFIFNQKEKRGFIWPKAFNFLFQKHTKFYSVDTKSGDDHKPPQKSTNVHKPPATDHKPPANHHKRPIPII